MKILNIILTLTLSALLAIQAPAYGWQDKQNTNVVVEQADADVAIYFKFQPDINHTGQVDIGVALAGGRSLIPFDNLPDDDLQEKLRGQSIRFITGTDGLYYLEIIHPDTASVMRSLAFDVIEGKAKAGPKKPGAIEFFSESMESPGNREKYEMPFRIHTKAQNNSGGQGLEVTVENLSGQTVTNLVVTPERVPEGWNFWPGEYKADEIRAYGSNVYAFRLETPIQADVEQVGFRLETDKLIFPWSVRVHPGSAGKESIPDKFELHGNYPNPFNPSTTISYSLPETMQVLAEVYNIIGQRVAVLVNRQQTPGTHNIVWDASHAASGMYLYRVVAVGKSGNVVLDERKMMLIK